MSVLTRTNYIPNTLILSAAVNVDFNQLVDLLSGVSTTKDALIKFSNATDPVLRVDQLGAGIIQRWLQNGTEKGRVNNDGSFNIGTPGGSPTAGLIAGPESSGTNIAGANMVFHGGKGTGNAVPGLPVFRYPLIGASGTTLQSLSSNSFPPVVNMFTHQSSDTTVANTTTETTLLGAGDAGTKTLEAGMGAVARYFYIKAWGTVATTGTPNLRIKLKLGSTIIADTGNVIVMAANTNSGSGGFMIEAVVAVEVTGSSGTLFTSLRYTYNVANGGGLNQVSNAINTAAFDLTTNQTWDLTAQWSAASASNTVTVYGTIIEMGR